MNGKELIQILISATGLPRDAVQFELEKTMLRKGFDKETLTLNQLRVLLAEYMQDVLLNAKKEYSD